MILVDVALMLWMTIVLVVAAVLVVCQGMIYKTILHFAVVVAEQEREPTQHPVHHDTMMLPESAPLQTTTCRILHLSLQNGEISSRHRVFVAIWSQHRRHRRRCSSTLLMGGYHYCGDGSSFRNTLVALIHCSLFEGGCSLHCF